MEDLSAIPMTIAAGAMALSAGFAHARADQAVARADDAGYASRVFGAAANAHARAAMDMTEALVGAEAEIERLRDLVATLQAERTAILRGAARLMSENETLRARVH